MKRWRAPARLPWLIAAAALGATATVDLFLKPAWRDAAEAAPVTARASFSRPAPPTRAAELPPAGDPTPRVADLLEAAIRSGLAVQRLQQRADTAGAVERLDAAMSVRGRYSELRGFLAVALSQDHALALERIQIRRSSASPGVLDAEIQWALLSQRSITPTTP